MKVLRGWGMGALLSGMVFPLVAAPSQEEQKRAMRVGFHIRGEIGKDKSFAACVKDSIKLIISTDAIRDGGETYPYSSSNNFDIQFREAYKLFMADQEKIDTETLKEDFERVLERLCANTTKLCRTATRIYDAHPSLFSSI